MYSLHRAFFQTNQIAFAIFKLHGLICQLNSPFPLSSSVTLAMAEVVNIGGVSPGHNSATRYPTNGKWEITNTEATPSLVNACK